MAGIVHAHSALVSQILLTYGSRPDIRLWKTSGITAHDRNGRVYRALPGGHPDISGIIKGGYRIDIEVKTGKALLTKKQVAFAEMLLRFGGCYIVARSLIDVGSALSSFSSATRSITSWEDPLL